MRTMNRDREARKEKKLGCAFKTSTKGGALQASKSIIAGCFEKSQGYWREPRDKGWRSILRAMWTKKRMISVLWYANA